MHATTYRSPGTHHPINSHRPTKKRRGYIKIALLLIVAVAVVFVASDQVSHHLQAKPVKQVTKTSQTTAVKPATAVTKTPATTTPVAAAAVNPCASNTLSQLVLVSISQRHLWACNASAQIYNSAVVTGMENLAADLTPVGTYHIYAKETNITLKGSDSTGSWDDPVSYWMPFLDNQYGAYGFHDATWRASTAFGNISPYSSNASHGCVECPLATAKWLYGWAVVGTTVTIES